MKEHDLKKVSSKTDLTTSYPGRIIYSLLIVVTSSTLYVHKTEQHESRVLPL